MITIGTDSLRPEEVRFFEYHDDGGKQLRFLLGRDSFGKIVGVADARELCYIHGKAFAIRVALVRRYCGNRYKPDAPGTGVALSRMPAKLPLRIRGHNAEINPAGLERSRGLF